MSTYKRKEQEKRRGYWWRRVLDAAASYSNNRALFDDDSSLVYSQACKLRTNHHLTLGQLEQLYHKAKAMRDHYVQLVVSGDAGNWDPHDEEVVSSLGAILEELAPLFE